MRITGLVLALIGVAVALFCGVAALSEKAPNENDAVLQVERRAGPDLTVPLVLAGAAIVAGCAMYALGGRGYRATPGTGTPPAHAV